MSVTLIGVGMGNPDTMTVEARRAVERSDYLIGSRRLLEGLGRTGAAAVRAVEILELLRTCGARRPCVLYSGDAGFYSGAGGLIPLLEGEKIPFQVLPGISSAQYFAAKLGRPWQDWKLVSAHGTERDPVAAVLEGRDVFFLTGGAGGAAELCRRLTQAGLGELRVAVGERLSYPEERIVRGTAAEFSGKELAPLCVMLAQGARPRRAAAACGIPDGEFIRGQVPMTKREVRAAILSNLEICNGEILYDIGAGTGSVAVEMALLTRTGRVYAVEQRPEAWELIGANREKFGAYGLELVRGRAPEALEPLPAPDGAFIGGSGGALEEILDCLLDKNPRVRLCISAIAAETLGRAVSALAGRGIEPELTQLSVARSKAAGGLHLMMAQNPVWLICGRGE